MEQLDPVRVSQRLRQLGQPGFHVARIEPAFSLQKFSHRISLESIHRDRRTISVLHEIINAENVRMNELPILFHLLTEFRHRASIADDRWRDEMKRHILAKHLVTRQPDRGAPRTAEVLSKDVTTGDFSSFGEGWYGG